MALSRRSGSRLAANIWPGFVDAMTALLLVLMFVLTIFMIVQYVMRETITGQESELDVLSSQVAGLARALGLEEQRSADLGNQVDVLDGQLSDAQGEIQAQALVVASLTSARDAAQVRIASFEEQVASLIAQNTNLDEANAGLVASLATAKQELLDQEGEVSAAQLALALARSELDSEAEVARLAAAKADALQALIDDLEASASETGAEIASLQAGIDEAEATRLLEAAAAEVLRQRLLDANTELTAMTLALEDQRQKAEDTLTLLAAAEAARKALDTSSVANLSEIDLQAALIAQANDLLSQEKELSAESQRQVELLNQQTAALRIQLDTLQGLLDASEAKDIAAQIQVETLGSDLNAALARVAAEQSARAELEAAERARLEAEAVDLRSFRSEFFGRIRQVLGEREGVQVVGDRFVFSSEVLFAPGSATLGAGGKAQISHVAAVIRDIADEIPDEINWILRVDGHTDNTGIGTNSDFADNWELSQARALSVVKFLIEQEGIPANRLAATGFGEFQPIAFGDSPEDLAQNRRIELKLTEK